MLYTSRYMNKAAIKLRTIMRELKDLESFQTVTQRYIADTYAHYYDIWKAPLPVQLQGFPILYQYTATDGTAYIILENDFKDEKFDLTIYQKNMEVVKTQVSLLKKNLQLITTLKQEASRLCEMITDQDLKDARDYEEKQQVDLHYQYKKLSVKRISLQEVLFSKFPMIYQTHRTETLPHQLSEVVYHQRENQQEVYFLKGDYLPKSEGFIKFTERLIQSELYILSTINQKLVLLETLIQSSAQTES